MNHKERERYIPALSYDWLTPLYDPLLRVTTRELAIKRRLVEQAKIRKGHRVLDLGCGTATLTLLIKETQPKAEVVGLDGDPKILALAKAKASKAGLEINLNQAMSFDLPYVDCSFDRVLSSLVFHHLTPDNKVRTLREVFRVLRPDGELHVADFGKPHNNLMRIASFPWRVFDGFRTTAENVKGLLPELFQAAGLSDAQESSRYMTLFGTLSLYEARKT